LSEWYYARGDEQTGPITEAELENLVALGIITTDTLVWKAGMEEWAPYGEVSVIEGPASAPLFDDAPSPTPMLLDPGFRACHECGRPFPEDDLVAYEDFHVCADCKPVFFQRLRESGTAATLQIASFGSRFVAKLVDVLLMTIPMVIVGLTLGFGFADDPDALFFLFQIGINLAYYVIWGSYSVYFHGRFGATPGKMLMGLQVIRSDGSPIGYGRAFGRFFAEILSGFVCYIGYFIAAFDDHRRTLHDHMCDTRVVTKA